MRGAGVPIIGYTWFPLFTMIDWPYRFGSDPIENYYLELGLYHLNRNDDNARWHPSSLVERYKTYISDSVGSIGEISRVFPESKSSIERTLQT